jgi:hypothetical protein
MSISAAAARRWSERPGARQVILITMRVIVKNCQEDLMPTLDNSKMIGLYNKDTNVETARYS